LVLAVLVLVGTGLWLRIWLPLRTQLAEQARTQTELARRLDALDAWQATVNDDLAALEGRSRDLTGRLDRLGPAQLAEWSLAEAAYLLRGAQRSAAVDYDPARAALALGLASASLAPVPHSDGVRRAIDSARAALEKVQGPDLNALGEELARAAEVLRTAALAGTGRRRRRRSHAVRPWRGDGASEVSGVSWGTSSWCSASARRCNRCCDRRNTRTCDSNWP